MDGTSQPTDYYELLEVSRQADKDAIKKAYRRQALKYHPDKVGQDPEKVARFQAINKAYEILSDEKKRSIYDRYGEQGISMMDNIPFLDPEMLLTMNKTFGIATLLVLSLFLFPIFISLRADGKVSWSWIAVFVPAFLAVGAAIAGIAFSSPGGDDDEDQEKDPQDKEKDDRDRKREAMQSKIMGVGYLSLVLLLLILLSIQLQGSLSSWWAVFAPWYVLEVVHVLSSVRSLREKLAAGLVLSAERAPGPDGEEAEGVEVISRPYTGIEKVGMVLEEFLGWALRILQAILIPIKLTNPDSFSWVMTFLPSFLIGALYFVVIIIGCVSVRADHSLPPELNRNRRYSLTARMIIFIVGAIFVFTTIGLLIKRLESGDANSPSTAVILIPVFIILSLLLLLVGCLLPCLLCLTRLGLEAEMNGPREEGWMRSVVSSDRRIENTQGQGNASGN
ncbi:hypothetical protein HK101_000264 [Irineochytrium annulatum]|nr:hypothetical protein HK101_000264 [Irineochytrium annulatum]